MLIRRAVCCTARWVIWQQRSTSSTPVSLPLRSKKAKSKKNTPQHFVDMRHVRVIGGKGGDGAISFLSVWCNEKAGPDGGDGGNGGHVVFEATSNVKDLRHIESVIKADEGEKGYNTDCHGKNADNKVVQVPVGTIIKEADGKIVGDLEREGTMFLAARGGAGGHGNHFFATALEQAPKVAEYGAQGEDLKYILEVSSMAHFGLIGFPNAGKSTLLQAISRARPKIAPYPFTTLKPHIGVVQYDDYDQLAVADLPGLIPGSHKNRGLGITFLKHAERCSALLYILDMSLEEPWNHLDTLQYEVSQFSPELIERPQLVVANKMDLPESKVNLQQLKSHTTLPVIAISAKTGNNLCELLNFIKRLYDTSMKERDSDE